MSNSQWKTKMAGAEAADGVMRDLDRAYAWLCKRGATYVSTGRIDEAASHAREALALNRRLGLGEARPTPSASPGTSRRPAAPQEAAKQYA